MKGKLYNFYILHQRKYRENYLLLSIFTSEFGKLSAIVRVSKKQMNLYQPLVKLQGEISFAKKDSGLNRLYNIEIVDSFYKKKYICLLSLQYVNELIYLLLNYPHEEEKLFQKYNFVIEHINHDNYRYLLRFFELELLESLGQTIHVENDIDNQKISADMNYYIVPGGFKLSLQNNLNTAKGINLLKINEPVHLWNENDLKAISRVTRISIDNALSGKQLKTRKLLLDFLNLTC